MRRTLWPKRWRARPRRPSWAGLPASGSGGAAVRRGPHGVARWRSLEQPCSGSRAQGTLSHKPGRSLSGICVSDRRTNPIRSGTRTAASKTFDFCTAPGGNLRKRLRASRRAIRNPRPTATLRGAWGLKGPPLRPRPRCPHRSCWGISVLSSCGAAEDPATARAGLKSLPSTSTTSAPYLRTRVETHEDDSAPRNGCARRSGGKTEHVETEI